MSGTWNWKEGKKPGPQKVRAGICFDFTLPLQGQGELPECKWDIPFPDLDNQAPADQPLRLILNIPAKEKGFKKIGYQVQTSPRIEGILHLQIIPAEEPAFKAESEKAQDLQIKKTHQPEPAKEEQSAELKENQITPEPGPVSRPGTEPKQEKPAPSMPKPLPQGNYIIRVFQQGTLINNLKARVEEHKSLNIGRKSFSANIYPDIDLSACFQDKQKVKQISRKQLRVFWHEGRIIAINEGKATLGLPGGENLTSKQEHYWQPGENIQLPGQIRLSLGVEE